MRALTLAALVAVMAGCLTPAEYRPTINYSVVPRPEVAQAAPTPRTLGIRPLDPAQALRSKVAYRSNEYVIEYYPYAQWAEPPRDVVTRAIADALIESGRFADVGDSRDVKADLILTGELRNFEEVRTDQGRAAQVAARLELRTAQGDKAVWAGLVEATEPVVEDGPAGLAAALSRATARLAEQAAAAIVER